MLVDEPDREAFAPNTAPLFPLKTATGQGVALMTVPALVLDDEARPCYDDLFSDDEVRGDLHVPQSYVGKRSCGVKAHNICPGALSGSRTLLQCKQPLRKRCVVSGRTCSTYTQCHQRRTHFCQYYRLGCRQCLNRLKLTHPVSCQRSADTVCRVFGTEILPVAGTWFAVVPMLYDTCCRWIL